MPTERGEQPDHLHHVLTANTRLRDWRWCVSSTPSAACGTWKEVIAL
jgi:hypothetical protein